MQPSPTKLAYTADNLTAVGKLTMFASNRLIPELLKADTALNDPTHLSPSQLSPSDGREHNYQGFNPFCSVASAAL